MQPPSVYQNGVGDEFVQDNHSLSASVGTVRGLHFQMPPHAQAKLVRCGRGAIFDVVVDIRQGSPTYGRWAGYTLSAENGAQLYITVGFATLEPDSEIIYKCSDYYAPETESALCWDDPNIGIKWPLTSAPVLSEKDAAAPLLAGLNSAYPTPAARPLNSRLECNTTTSVFGLARPDWHAGLKECLTQLGVST